MLRIGLLLGIAFVCSCALDQQKFAAGMADYAARPENKAMYFHTAAWSQHWVWSKSTAEEAVSTAKDNCEQYALQLGGDPADCTLLAVNSQQLWDPTKTCLRCLVLQRMASGQTVMPSGMQPQYTGNLVANEDLIACGYTSDGPACQDPDGQWYLVDGLPADGLVASGVGGLAFYRRGALHRDPRRHLSHRAAQEMAARWHPHEVQRARMEAQANLIRLRAQQMPHGFVPRQTPVQFFRPQPGVVQPGHVVVPQYPVVRPAPRQQNCRPNQQFCR